MVVFNDATLEARMKYELTPKQYKNKIVKGHILTGDEQTIIMYQRQYDSFKQKLKDLDRVLALCVHISSYPDQSMKEIDDVQ